MALPIAIHTTAQVRALDAFAIGTLGVPGYTLMKRAGEAALRVLRSRWPTAHRVVIVCGGGNNGGDGYVLARFAQAAGLTTLALAAVPPERLRGDARRAYEDFTASQGRVLPFAAEQLAAGDVVVDALLGTGLDSAVRPEAASAIQAINAAGRPVLALDVPSGLSSDLGLPLGCAVRADATVTFVALKTGLFLGDAPEYVGALSFDDLEIAPPDRPEFVARLTRLTEAEIARALPRRARAAHKGSFGRVLIVGGGPGMPGAARLAGEAALRVGAGLVTVAAAADNLAAIAAGRPELICAAVDAPEALDEPLERADVVAIGPGLGRSHWAARLLERVVASDKPLIVDADGLNLIADGSLAVRRDDWILTPHPGEAARLLGTSTAAVQSDRLAALERLSERCGGLVVLKGAGTLIGRRGEVPAICERGNPGMATAGMGDVLTGTIAGVLAQCGEPWVAARVGVLIHALAGDTASHAGERGLIASDVIRELRTWANAV